MTDKGYYEPGQANGHEAHETGAPNGLDTSAPVMMFDSTPVSSARIAEDDEAAWNECAGEDALEDADHTEAEESAAEDTEVPDTDETADACPGEAGAEAGDDCVIETEADQGAAGVEEPEADAAEAGEAAEDAEPAAPEFTDEDRRRHLRMGEALLFASAEPLRKEQIAERLPDGADVDQVLADLAEHYADRGVNLMRVAGGWAFRTATDLSFLMERERVEQRKLSRAALETLAIIAYHQPVTRAEIEDVRGVSVSKGTIDVLMEIGWVRVRGRRQTPGRPVTYGTSDMFLEHFGLDRISDLPGLDELKAAGLLDTRMPANIHIPRPSDEDEAEADADTQEEEEESLYARDDEVDDDRLAEGVGPEDGDASDEGPSSLEADDGHDAVNDVNDPDADGPAADGGIDDKEHGAEGEPEAQPVAEMDCEDDEGFAEDLEAPGAELDTAAPDAEEEHTEAGNGVNGSGSSEFESDDGEEDWPPRENAVGGAPEGRDSRS